MVVNISLMIRQIHHVAHVLILELRVVHGMHLRVEERVTRLELKRQQGP